MLSLTPLRTFVEYSWSRHPRRSCILILLSQVFSLLSLIIFGFVYIHMYFPNYNAKRLSKIPFVCSTISNRNLPGAECELPWNHSKITLSKNIHRKLFEEDGHSVTVSFLRAKSKENESEIRIAQERHFAWSSCGEFCSEEFVDNGGCRQLRVNVRTKGTAIHLQGCHNIRISECEFLKMGKDPVAAHNEEDRSWREQFYKKQRVSCFPTEDPNCLRLGLFECHHVDADEVEQSTVTPSTSTSTTGSVFSPIDSVDTVMTTTALPSSVQETAISPPPTLALLQKIESDGSDFSPLPNTSTRTKSQKLESLSEKTTMASSNNDMIEKNSSSETSSRGNIKKTQKVSASKAEISKDVYQITTTTSSNPSQQQESQKLSKPQQLSLQSRSSSKKTSSKKLLQCTRIERTLSCDPSLSMYYVQSFNCSPPSTHCFKKPGIYICDSTATCKRIQDPDTACHRTCDKLMLDEVNTVLTDSFGGILTATCDKATHAKKKFELWPRRIKHKVNPNQTPTLLLNCNKISPLSRNDTLIQLNDCTNGTRLENLTLPHSSTIQQVYELWHESMKTEDYLLDPIEQRHAPPERNITVFEHVPLYFDDFYKSSNVNGCTLPGEEDCRQFYQRYGRVYQDLRGQSVFKCFCRNLNNVHYCVIGDRDAFEHFWEDGVVEFLNSYGILVLILVGLLCLGSLLLLALLLYPLAMDLVKYERSVEVTPIATVSGTPISVSTYRNVHGRRGHINPGKSPARLDVNAARKAARSRSNSIISAVL